MTCRSLPISQAIGVHRQNERAIPERRSTNLSCCPIGFDGLLGDQVRMLRNFQLVNFSQLSCADDWL